MSDFLTRIVNTILLRPERSIGGIQMDVTLEEKHDDELEVTEHPVEQGASINDHAWKKPAVVAISGAVGDCSLPGFLGDKPSVAAYQALVKLQESREPFDIVTGKRKYRNMVMTGLSVTTDAAGENALFFSAECREVIIVSTETATVTRSAARSKQANAARKGGTSQKGSKSAASTTKTPRKSMLKEMFG